MDDHLGFLRSTFLKYTYDLYFQCMQMELRLVFTQQIKLITKTEGENGKQVRREHVPLDTTQ
jgi:hypothetical protein